MIDIHQLPFVRNILKAEKVKYENEFKNFNDCEDIFSVKDTHNNPIQKLDGLFCISDYKEKKVVYVFVVLDIIKESRNIIKLKPLVVIKWQTWINFGGHKIVTRPGKLKQNAIKFIPKIMELIPPEKNQPREKDKKIKIIKKKPKINEVIQQEEILILKNSEMKILKLQEETDMFTLHLTSLNERYKDKIYEKEEKIRELEERFTFFKTKMLALISSM
jgi:hypothetical protein